MLTMMKKNTIIFCMLFLIVPMHASAAGSARSLAEGAFYAIEDEPFDTVNVNRAFRDIKRAEDLDSNEPWVAIATSRAFLEIGYQKGGRFREQSFKPEALEKAEYYARQGVDLGPTISVAHSQLARVQIVLGNYRAAWETLNKAHRLAPDDFYPWYFRSVIAVQMKDKERASLAIEEAERRVDRSLHRSFVLGQRKAIALAMGSEKEKEAAYKAIIANEPMSAHAHGNYGAFLLRRERYDEAIKSLEKAVSIARYPVAVEQLERARKRGK